MLKEDLTTITKADKLKVNNVTNSTIVKEFLVFKNMRVQMRSEILKANSMMKNQLHKEKTIFSRPQQMQNKNTLDGNIDMKTVENQDDAEESEFININDVNPLPVNEPIEFKSKHPFLYRDDEFEYSPQEVNIPDNIIVSPSVEAPKGIFVYPVEDNIRRKKEYNLKNLIRMDDEDKFDKMMGEISPKIKQIFASYPGDKKEYERIDNPQLVNWLFVQIKLAQEREKLSLDNNTIIDILAIKLNKTFSCVYKCVSEFLLPLIQKWEKEEKAKNPLLLQNYRKSYCNICMKFLCVDHFSFIRKKEKFEIKGEKLLIYEDDFQRKFTEIESKKMKKPEQFSDNQNNNFKCEECMGSYLIELNLRKFEKINKEFMEIFNKCVDKFKKEDLYLLLCAYFSGVINSSITCLIRVSILDNRVRCIDVRNMLILLDAIKRINNIREDNLHTFLDKFKFPLPDVYLKKLILPVEIEKEKNKKSKAVKIDMRPKNLREDKVPCVHTGPCEKSNCDCVREISYCEKSCSCFKTCKYMAKGCKCTNNCNISEFNAECHCAKYDRECDPDLCSCDLDNCKNMGIINDKVKKTALAKSLICDNYGLFAMEDIQENEFICEYKGEMMSLRETERKNIFNDYLGQNYIFNLSEKTDIDAYRVGNKMRYVNHSSHGFQNCYSKNKYVRGVNKIALYALRNIKKGEELYFDYNFSVKLDWVKKYDALYKK